MLFCLWFDRKKEYLMYIMKIFAMEVITNLLPYKDITSMLYRNGNCFSYWLLYA